MSVKKNKIIKISMVILLLLLFFFSVKFFLVKNEFTEFKENSELEIKILESQLGEILHKYDSLSEDSKRYGEITQAIIDSGTLVNNSLYNELVNDSLVFYAEKAKKIKTQITQKTQVVSNKSSGNSFKNSSPKHLSVSNINAKGVKIYSDLYKSSNSQIQQLRVCYTLQKNDILKEGSRKIYIQVVNPKNQIISKTNSSVENALGAKLQYSALSEVNYDKNDTDVCAYVDLEKNKTVKGNYIINIYSEFTKIGTTTFQYK